MTRAGSARRAARSAATAPTTTATSRSTRILPPAPSARLSVRADGEVRWTEPDDAPEYELVRGSLATLRDTRGDFGQAADTCLLGGEPGSSRVDPDAPEPGAAFFYLVRGRNCAGFGSWDSGGAGQPESRDGFPTPCGF